MKANRAEIIVRNILKVKDGMLKEKEDREILRLWEQNEKVQDMEVRGAIPIPENNIVQVTITISKFAERDEKGSYHIYFERDTPIILNSKVFKFQSLNFDEAVYKVKEITSRHSKNYFDKIEISK